MTQAQIALDSQNAYQLFIPDKIDIIEDRGFKFIMHYYKTNLMDIFSKQPRRKNPLLPPFDTDIHVCDLTEGAHHHILINKFMQCKGHIVISSMEEGFQQGSDLTISDFCAFEKVFQSFDYDGILYYNAGINSGCTQLHKHIQYTPMDKTPILDSMINEKLPIFYHVKKIDGQITSQKMYEAYIQLQKEAKEIDPPHDSYNFIISKGNAFYVPRKRTEFKCGTHLNSVAVTGNFPVWDWSDQSLTKEPLSVLEYICFPTV